MIFPEQYRVKNPAMRTPEGARYGFFVIPKHKGNGNVCRTLKVIATTGDMDANTTQGWDHVSVTVVGDDKATPTWSEMCRVKKLFFEPETVAVQFHPAASQYVNVHLGCLHLFSHPSIQTPPMILI
jgi:hypothetical protein